VRFKSKESTIYTEVYRAIVPLLKDMKDAHIASRVGCSREYVWQVRKKYEDNKQR